MSEQSKASKINQHGIPWAAVVVAALGWYDARGTGKDAAADANQAAKQAQVSKVKTQEISEARLKNAYESIQEALAHQEARTTDLEDWVVELEEWVEDSVEEDSPRTARERDARDQRLAMIREKKQARAREKRRSPHAKPAAKLKPYDTVQMTAAPLDLE